MTLDVQSGVTLRLRFTQDRELHYRISTSVSQEMLDKGTMLGREENAFEVQMVQRVLRVEADGSAHVVTVSQPVGSMQSGVPGAPVHREVTYSHLGGRGDVLEVSGFNPGSSYSFPEHPVRVGEAWEGRTRLQVPMRAEPIEGTNRFVLVGSEHVNGYDCVKIQVKAEERNFQVPLPDRSGMAAVVVESQGTLWFAPDPGFLVRLEMQTHSVPKIGESAFDTTNRMVQELVKVQQAQA